jgi:hypothetical protein
VFCWECCKKIRFWKGIGNHVLVDFLLKSGFVERGAKKGESLAKRMKNGCFIVLRNHHKTSERDSEKCGDATPDVIAW